MQSMCNSDQRVNINGRDCDDPPYGLATIFECGSERIGEFILSNYYNVVSDEGTCDTPTFLEV